MIDEYYINRKLRGLKAEPQLFVDSREQGRECAVGCLNCIGVSTPL